MKLLSKSGEILTDLDLGIVDAGDTKEYSYIFYNDTEAELVNIEVKILDKEVTILSSPKNLNPYEKAEFKIKWSPSLEIKKGLKTSIEINAQEIYS